MIAAPLLGLFLNLDAVAIGAVALTLLAGTPALTFIGLIGAALVGGAAARRTAAAVLVLPLTVPVLIFGVAASNAAIVGPVPFGTPFTILCALTLGEPGARHRSPPRRRCGTDWSKISAAARTS